jgi:hypothetical protein
MFSEGGFQRWSYLHGNVVSAKFILVSISSRCATSVARMRKSSSLETRGGSAAAILASLTSTYRRQEMMLPGNLPIDAGNGRIHRLQMFQIQE